MANIIEVQDISKQYQLCHNEPYYTLRDAITNVFCSKFHKKKEVFWALKNINFSVEKGEAIGIIGKNGAGKSTLLKILSRITPPTTGQVILKGRIASLLEVGTGFHPELTGRENIFLNGAILGMKKKEIQKKFTEIVAFAEIEKFLDTPVKRYSSGMYVRLAFAVAAHLEPEILLVDEVLAVGDAQFQKKCLGKMDEVTRNKGRTILFVSHNMGAIQKLCNTCILLENGFVKNYNKTNIVVDEYIKSNNLANKAPLNKLRDRNGDHKIIITEFFIEDLQGKKTNFVSSGDTIRLCFRYKKNFTQILDDVDLNFAVTGIDGAPLILHKSSYKKQNFRISQSEGVIKCTIKHLPLASGLYNIGTYLLVDQQLSDRISTVTTFEVLMGDFFKTGLNYQENHSPILINGEWELT